MNVANIRRVHSFVVDGDLVISNHPIDDLGKQIEPEARFDDWDDTPHGYFLLGIAQVQLSDMVFGGTHQVEGFGRAEQRGMEARRLDLNYVAFASLEASARVILPIDHVIEVKRYFDVPFAVARVDLKDSTGVADYRAGFIPDYEADTAACGCLTGDTNAHGFDDGQTMCDACVGSWQLDYDVTRHHRRTRRTS